MKTTLSIILAISTVFAVVGCGAGGPPDLNKDYMTTAAETRKDVDAMYKKTGGDYSKLSTEEHDRYVKYFAGKEEAAKAYWEKMKTGGGFSSSMSEAPKGK